MLWCAVREVQTLRPDAEVVVYTGDDLTGAELTRRAALRFGVTLARPIDVVKLRRRRLVEPDAYPALTLVGQAVGACVLALGLTANRTYRHLHTDGNTFIPCCSTRACASTATCLLCFDACSNVIEHTFMSTFRVQTPSMEPSTSQHIAAPTMRVPRILALACEPQH